MKSARHTLFLLLAVLFLAQAALAQRQMEMLNRGVIAVRTSTTQAYIGWRLLGTDPDDVSFNLYRLRSGTTNKLNGSPITSSCNFVDTPPNFSVANEYFVTAIIGGVEQPAQGSWVLPASAPTRQYLSIPLTQPPGGTSPPTANGNDSGGPYTYNANDCSVGDMDGDGEYEILLKWDPTNSKDNSQSGFTGNTYLDCYKLDGTQLWRLNLGPNIRSGAHYMDFMVYDFDGDGKAELMCRTAPGSKDGAGNYVGGLAKWQSANGPHPTFDDTDDYRDIGPNGENGYVLAGPEFLTVFNGETGVEMATSTWYPKRDPDNNEDNPTASRINQVWGDGYGNRLDRFLAGIAFCDGVRPSAIFCRGYYTRAYLAAWDWRNGELSIRWTFNSNDGNPANLAYRGQGAHSLSIGDLDGDGKDEITYGACAIDDDGSGLYSTGLGHGDAEHMSDMDPFRDGQEIWFVHESPSSYGPYGLEMHDSKTGEILLYQDGQNADVGRGVAIDIDPNYPGYEMWGSRGGLMNATGVQLPYSRPGSMNFACWWDADLLREILDGTTISKWNWNSGNTSSLLSPSGLSSNNGTKSTPCLSADLFGDWREEVIWRTSDNSALRIYTTTVSATNRIYTLMHDPQYRCAIAWQNTGYNQPPHPGFNIGPDMYSPPRAPVSLAQLAWRGGYGGNAWTAANNWFVNGVWTSDQAATYSSGNSVLFDLRAGNNTNVSISGTIMPGDITVHSPSDFTFSGSGTLSGPAKLFKAGPGRLTIHTTNSFTGGTYVSGGQLFVNGALSSSPVVVASRGEPWGRAKIGGGGELGQGLTVQKDCGLIVGPDINAPGTLTIGVGLTEQGGVLNQFDLSNSPEGPNNDVIHVEGQLTLSGINTIEITQLDGSLGDGLYPLITYSGGISGGLGNLTLVGDFLQPVALTNPPGMIALSVVVPADPPIAPTGLSATPLSTFQISLAWTDNAADENEFLIERSLNNVDFATIATVGANETMYQDATLSADITYYYRVSAINLAGASDYATASATTPVVSPTLIWRGDGSGNEWDIASMANWWNAGPTIFGDGANVLFDNSGSDAPPVNIVEPVAPGSVTVSSSQDYTFSGSGSLLGTMSLAKTGSGDLTINTLNSFSGGTTISGGTLRLGNLDANSSGLGTGPVTFMGGTLEFAGISGSSSPEYGGSDNALVVPVGETGTILVPQRFQAPGVGGILTGGGTMNFVMYYVRGTISGDMSGFTGQINAVSSDGSDDFRLRNTAGMPLARLHLGNGINMYYQNSPANFGPVVPIGELAGDDGAVISVSQSSSGNTSQGQPATWVVGGLNTDATYAGLIIEQTTIVKAGSGIWTMTGTCSYSGTTAVDGGTLRINGDNSAATGDVVVGPGGTLGGTGMVGGNTTVNGTLSPGTLIGTSSFAGDLTLTSNSTSLFEISKVPLQSDRVVVSGGLVLGGTLTVVSTSIESFDEGDTFDLFDSSNISGEFSAFDFPTLDSGLRWNTDDLAANGVIIVVPLLKPEIEQFSVVDGNVTFAGSGGSPGGTYYLLGSSNIIMPLSNWPRLLTNEFDGDGAFSMTNAIAPGAPLQFYSIEAQ